MIYSIGSSAMHRSLLPTGHLNGLVDYRDHRCTRGTEIRSSRRSAYINLQEICVVHANTYSAVPRTIGVCGLHGSVVPNLSGDETRKPRTPLIRPLKSTRIDEYLKCYERRS